jgi:hypothetical protein
VSHAPVAAPALLGKRLTGIRPRAHIHCVSFPPSASSDEPHRSPDRTI